jgi:glycosylphosphatidylinositol transamidase (GPIT) subunit GPI8
MGEYDKLTDYDEQHYLLNRTVEEAKASNNPFVPQLRAEESVQWNILVYGDAGHGGEAWFYFDKMGNFRHLRISKK